MTALYLHVLLVQLWGLAHLVRGRPTDTIDEHLLDYAASPNFTIPAKISATSTALLIKQLVTTSFVETMPSFLSEQSAQLELVDGNRCYTIETVDQMEVGNLMARKTCWCMTVIDVPVTDRPTPHPSTATATIVATPVYTTTVTVFASSVVETVYETVRGPDGNVRTTTRYRFEPSTISSPKWLSSSSSPFVDEEPDSSTWIPENIISTSWPSNTINVETSIPYRSMAGSAIEPTTSIWSPGDSADIGFQSPRESSWDLSVRSLSSDSSSAHSLESSMREQGSSDPWDAQSTPVLTSLSSTARVDSMSVTSFTSVGDDVTTFEVSTIAEASGTARPDILPSPSLVDASEFLSPRSGDLDSEDLTAESTPIISSSISSVGDSWGLFTTSLVGVTSPLGSDSTNYEATLSLSIDPTRTYASSTDWHMDASGSPSIWLSESYDSGSDSAPNPSWTYSSYLATTNDTGSLLYSSDSEWPNETPTFSLDIITPMGSTDIASTDVLSTSCSSTEQEVSASSLSNPTLTDQSSIYQHETDVVSMTTTPLPISSITDTTSDNFSSPRPSPSYDPAIIESTASSASGGSPLDGTPTMATIATSGVLIERTPAESRSPTISPQPPLDDSTLVTDSENSDRWISQYDTVSLSSSETARIDKSDITVSLEATTVAPEESTQGSMWTHSTQVTYLPTRTTSLPPASSVVPTPTTTTTENPKLPSEKDTAYWIQTELSIPEGVNSTDTPTLVKKMAYLYELAYAQQYRRQRRFARPTSIRLVYVKIDYKERRIILVYVLRNQGRLVPAIEAVEKMRLVRDADMEKLLEHGIIVKAKPFEPGSFSASLEHREEPWYKDKLAWILVLALLVLLLLLLLLLLCCLCVRTRKRQKAEVKDAEVSSSFSQGEGRFSTTSGVTMPGESIRSYRDAVTSPVHFGETGTYRRSESPKFYENQAFEGSLEEPRVRRRPLLTQHTFEATFEGEESGRTPRAELTPPEVKPRRRIKNLATEQAAGPNELSAYQDIRIPASEIEIRPVVSELPSEDEDPSGEKIAEARRQLESMTERLNALVDNSLTVEDTRSKLYGSARQRLLVARKDYKHRSRSADAIDKYPGVSSVPLVSNPIYRDQPTQTLSTAQSKRSTPPHFLVTIHKDVGRTEQRVRQRHHQRTVEEWSSASRRVQYREPTAQVMDAIRHELDRAQDSNRESFA